jgi:hypothetical protein
MAEISQIEMELNNVDGQLEYLQRINQTQRYEKTRNLLEENNTLETSEVYEADLQAINRIYLTAIIQNGFLNNTDMEEVRKIAAKCITEIGQSVLTARDLLPNCERSIYSTDAGCADSKGNVYGRVQAETSFTIYPNPAMHTINISLGTQKDLASLSIHSLSGNTIISVPITQKEAVYSIDSSNLPSGIYFCKIATKEGTVLTKKVVVLQQ